MREIQRYNAKESEKQRETTKVNEKQRDTKRHRGVREREIHNISGKNSPKFLFKCKNPELGYTWCPKSFS